MSSMRPLVDQECAQPNALVQFSNRVLSDANSSRQMLPLLPSTSQFADQLSNEYLSQISARSAAPTNFSMHSLVREIRGVEASERASVAPQPGVWAQQYLSSTQPSAWAQEYMGQQRTQTPQSVMQEAWTQASRPIADGAMKWSAEYLADFDSAVQMNRNPDVQASNWTEEYLANQQQGDTDFWQNLESEWDHLAASSSEHEWLGEYEDSVAAMYKEYTMQDQNPYMNVDNPLEKGKQLLSQGDLANAILLFEAAVQKEPINTEAWQLLGMTQAENEQEPSAIAALKKALELDPTNLTARFSLAVAFTNESLYNDAMRELEQWLAHNPAYAHLVSVGEKRRLVSSFLDRNYFNDIEEKFLRAASAQPGQIDSQLQNTLGVLYNLSGNFERAVDSLQAALRVTPEDPRLWNRLGATLANSDKSAEAVAAYSKALQLYPGFVRARYNLGISCLNLKSHKEAIEHFVSALSLQQRGLGPTSRENVSDSIWQTMRMATMSIPDSAISAPRGNLLEAIDRKDFVQVAQMFGINMPTPVPEAQG